MFPASANRYKSFLEEVFSALRESSTEGKWPENSTELDIQSLWFAGDFGRAFTTTCGKKITLRDWGEWNHSAGPDFLNCSIEVDGEIKRGAIELDPDVRDWERHGHAANADYEQVILHLYLHAPDSRLFTRTAAHKEVLQVQLTPDMLAKDASPRHLPDARLGRCSKPLAKMNDSQISSLLEAAAQYRLSQKSKRLQQWSDVHGREQAIYQSLGVALGYRPNQRAFTILTQRLPLKMLQKLPSEEMESLLFGVSGFLESVRYEDTQPDTRLYLRTVWSTWWKQRHGFENWLDDEQKIQWKLAGIRPGNHPQRRLGALIAIIQGWRKNFYPLLDAEKWQREKFVDALTELKHSHWSTHYTLMASASPKPIALLGAARVQEILANVVYPWLIPANNKLWEEYKQLPALLENQKVKLAAMRLLGEGKISAMWQKRLYHQQALLQIYEDYCLEDDSACADCPFPEKLKQWS